jgi:hypothetical protein
LEKRLNYIIILKNLRVHIGIHTVMLSILEYLITDFVLDLFQNLIDFLKIEEDFF